MQVLSCAVLVACLGVRAAEEPDPVVGAYLERLAAVGWSGVVLVEDGEAGPQVFAAGLADREAAIPVTAETVFDLGSITKQFTAAAILLLEGQGRLALEDPITRWFDDVPADKHPITVHHLLTHAAGLPGALGDDEDAVGAAAFLRLALEAPLLFEPGTGYEYSNVGYSLLGIVIERISGLGYEEFLRRHLFLPSGMRATGYRLPESARGRVATGYRGDAAWGLVLDRGWLDDGPGWHLRANGGIHSTAWDMHRWIQALSGDAILPRAARDRMFHPHVAEGGGTFYGYGWVVVPTAGGRIITHNGGNGVYSADLRWLPAGRRCVFTASNQAEWIADDVTEAVWTLLKGGEPPLPPEVVAMTVPELEAFTGRYALQDGAAFVVSRRGTHLEIEPSGESAARLLGAGPAAEEEDADDDGPRVTWHPVSATRFAPFALRMGRAAPGAGVAFGRDDAGRRTLTVGSAQGGVTATRAGEAGTPRH